MTSFRSCSFGIFGSNVLWDLVIPTFTDVLAFTGSFLRCQTTDTRYELLLDGRRQAMTIGQNTKAPKAKRYLKLLVGSPERETSRLMYGTKYSDDSNNNIAESRGTVVALLAVQGWIRLVPGLNKLPPMRKLKIKDAVWDMSQQQNSFLWDFSRLECFSVDLTGYAFDRLLRTLTTQDFARLRTFKLRLQSNTTTVTCWDSLAALLRTCKELESLKIECQGWRSLALTDITQSGARLRKLRVISDSRPGFWAPILSSSELSDVLRCCPEIVDLALDIRFSVGPATNVSIDSLHISLSSLKTYHLHIPQDTSL